MSNANDNLTNLKDHQHIDVTLSTHVVIKYQFGRK